MVTGVILPTATTPIINPGDRSYVMNPVWYKCLSNIQYAAAATTPQLTALSTFNSAGIMVQVDISTYVGRSVAGTTNRISVTNGSGIFGNPTIDISSSYVGQSTITTLGTITTGTWNGSSISTTYTDAKLKTLTGTSNRITIGGTATDPTVDISTSYVGQSTITTLGTIATGVWNGSSISTTYTDAKLKTLTGTSNRITIGGTSTDPTVDISTSYVGQATITTLGTVSTGTWNGTAVDVAHGGTGDTSLTAYAVLCGGTTSTGAVQSIASVGTSGNVLTSNGAGALPTFQATGAAAAGTLTGTTLAANVVSSSLTSVGTISSGVWSGTNIAITKGGTGVATLPSGFLIGHGTSAITAETNTGWTAFTPTVSSSNGGDTVPTYSTKTGIYRQISDVVFIEWYLTNSAGGTAGSGSGNLRFALPVNANSTQLAHTSMHGTISNNTSTWILIGDIVQSGTFVTFTYQDAIGTTAAVTPDLQNNAARTIILSCVYSAN